MAFAKVNWMNEPICKVNTENLRSIKDKVDVLREKPVEEVKMKPKTCINCCAPLHSNVCEYCGSVYEVENKNDLTMRKALIDSGISAEKAMEIFSCGGCI